MKLDIGSFPWLTNSCAKGSIEDQLPVEPRGEMLCPVPSNAFALSCRKPSL